MEKKTLGIILTVLGGVAVIWTYTRVTSLVGQMHTWTPPFTSYETITIGGGGVALVVLIVGIVFLAVKQAKPGA